MSFGEEVNEPQSSRAEQMTRRRPQSLLKNLLDAGFPYEPAIIHALLNFHGT